MIGTYQEFGIKIMKFEKVEDRTGGNGQRGVAKSKTETNLQIIRLFQPTRSLKSNDM